MTLFSRFLFHANSRQSIKCLVTNRSRGWRAKFKRWKMLILMMRQKRKSKCKLLLCAQVLSCLVFIHYRFWNGKSENCPETRRHIAEQSRRGNRDNTVDLVERKTTKSQPKLFTDDGRPYCLNMAKFEFSFRDEVDRYELNLHVYK